jgi:hypothetical protein
MNWSSVEEWENLPEMLKNLGISVPDSELDALIEKVKTLGITVDTVDLDSVSQQIKNMYDLMKSLESGE